MTEAATARLDVGFAPANGRTVVASCFQAAPLKIAKCFALEGSFPGCASPLGACVMDASPGLLAGDFYQMAWRLQVGAHVLATTQGFTRVHPSRARPCRLQQHIELGQNTLLEWFPEPLMLYADAALASECEVEMAPDATLLFGETICVGRISRGEVFGFHSLSSRLRVRRAGQLVFLSQSLLQPASQSPQRVGAWGEWTHASSFYVFSEHADAVLRDALRATLDESPGVWGGVSTLERGGVAVSLLGRRAHDLQVATQLLRECARQYLSAPLR